MDYETASDKYDVIEEVVSGNRVLDVGCLGTDTVTDLHDQIRSWSDETIGIDLNKELAAEIDDVIIADAESYQIDKPVDVIVAGDLIEHLSNPGQFVARCDENLASNGRVLIVTPNGLGYRHFMNHLLMKDAVNRNHTCWFDAQTLRQLFARYGFREERLTYIRGAQGLGTIVESVFPQVSRDILAVFERDN